jgi:hypothetical protein
MRSRPGWRPGARGDVPFLAAEGLIGGVEEGFEVWGCSWQMKMAYGASCRCPWVSVWRHHHEMSES